MSRSAAFSESNARGRTHRRSAERVSDESSSDGAPATAAAAAAMVHPPDPVPTAPLSTDWEDEALTNFFADFVIQPDTRGFGTGYFFYLKAMCDEQPRGPDSYLLETARAAVCAAFANRHSINALIASARRHFNRALTSVQRVLGDPIKARSDEALSAIYLFGFCKINTWSLLLMMVHADPWP